MSISSVSQLPFSSHHLFNQYLWSTNMCQVVLYKVAIYQWTKWTKSIALVEFTLFFAFFTNDPNSFLLGWWLLAIPILTHLKYGLGSSVDIPFMFLSFLFNHVRVYSYPCYLIMDIQRYFNVCELSIFLVIFYFF